MDDTFEKLNRMLDFMKQHRITSLKADGIELNIELPETPGQKKASPANQKEWIDQKLRRVKTPREAETISVKELYELATYSAGSTPQQADDFVRSYLDRGSVASFRPDVGIPPEVLAAAESAADKE